MPVPARGILDRALRKSAAVWVAPAGSPARLVWAVWRAGALWVAVGGSEQQVPGLADGVPCVLTVRSPGTHSHLLDVPAVAARTDPDAAVRAALVAARRHGPPGWAEVYALHPLDASTG